MSDFLIAAWDLSAKTAQPVDDISAGLKSEHWYHFQRDAKGLDAWLNTQSLPEPLISSLLADDTRPRFEAYSDDCFLFILRGINLNEGSEPDDMLSIRLLWYRGALISTRKLPSKAVSNILSALQNQRGPSNIPDLLVSIIAGINGAIDTFLTPIEEQLNAYDSPKVQDLEALNALQSRLLRVRRYLKPQRYALDDLLQADLPELSLKKHHFKNGLDMVMRLNESIDFYLEQIGHNLMHIDQVQTQAMNRNTYLFSVIAGIFLPASFFTGLLGVNVAGIPGESEPLAFTFLCVSIVAIVLVEILLLRILRFI
ncbi:zinc transporter ZntB [Vibrio zhanjiangensis]|uniref:Zinc transporter ZntB n=1 Tax=Vibrio zhanjiangensis TaxID=1046128 RepID=A0ABQ6ETC4_9VIBR|nr:CorA family divalent cation transporter [Vibrio zhanjiangensis]GLT16417.1 zinc transporter ZntB [Vibrio zhanjiangensis]